MLLLLIEEMVEAWLQKQDKVLNKTGNPTWSILATALKKIGHNGIAEEIKEKEGNSEGTEVVYVSYSLKIKNLGLTDWS